MMINIKDAPKMYSILDEKILEHLLRCAKCRPGLRCIQYMSLREIQNNLRVGSSDAQKN